jgi:sodium transport system permease protein
MIVVIFLKELVDHLRDRRSVLGSMLLPIIGPLMLWGIFELVLDLSRDRPLQVPVVGAEHAPGLMEYLAAHGVETLPAPVDPEASVRSGDVALVLEIDADYPNRFKAGKSAYVRVIVDESHNKAHKTVRRVERLLLTYSQTLGSLRLMARGIAPEVAAPVLIEAVDLATPQKLAANLLNIIPMFLMLAALVGGMNIAIDTTAGERERGSLEPLLLNPASRATIATGKWLATFAAGSVVALVTLLGFMLTVRLLSLEKIGLRVQLGSYEALLMLGAVLPLAAFGAALQMLIATFAKSFKEAQTYLNLLNLLPLAPSMYLMLQPGQSERWMLPLPALAQVTTVVDVMRGDAVPLWHLAIIAGSSTVYVLICLFGLVGLLGKERIIFGRN